MTRPIAFPTWRTAWNALDGIPALLANADALMRRRARGNQLLLKPVDMSSAELRIAIEGLRRWTDGEPPAEVSKRPLIATRLYKVLGPALQAASWPRWLLLERAFLDGSETGDLLFSALVIRTMCEEAERLHILDLDTASVERLALSHDAAESAQFLQFLRAVRAIFDTPPDPRDFRPTDPDSNAISPSRLQSAKQALNDYVHPNYGSHIAALFPERAAAARSLLEGIIAAYDAFFALSWAEQPLTSIGTSLDVSPLQSWPRTVRRFTKRVLPEAIDETFRAAEEGRVSSEVRAVFKAPAVIGWLTSDHTHAGEVLSAPEIAGLVNSLRVVGETARHKTARRDAVRYHLWEGAGETDVLFLASARRAEQILSETFPDGAPSESEQPRWLHFNALALQLAMTLDDLKFASLKTQLVRQTVSRNPLGILLCVRSLIEHKAVASWLVKRLGSQWIEVGKRVKPAKDLPSHSAQLQETLAKFLAGTKGSAEDALPWTKREVRGRWTLHLGLPDVLSVAFEPTDGYRDFYAIASAGLHGRLFRGLDLLSQATRHSSSLSALSILVLERLCDQNEQMDLIAPTAILITNFQHAAWRGGAATAASESEARNTFGHFEGKLKPGRDYTGDGSKGSPFRFRSHLQFHQASYKLLDQLGIENASRQLKRTPDGFYDVYQTADRELWFFVRSFAKE